MTVALGELFSFEQLAQADQNPVAETAKQPTAEDIQRAIKSASEALSTVMQKIGEEMAKHQEEPKTEPQTESAEGNVRDADVEGGDKSA